MAPRIAPSLLAADMSDLRSEVQRVRTADMLHIDVMDGMFVPNLSFGPGTVSAIRPHTSLFLDAHLMVREPERLVALFAAAGADGITVHVESTPNLHRCLTMIRASGARAGVAVNPGTPICALEPVLDCADMVLLMTVNPGFGGQRFIESSLRRIAQARSLIEESGLSVHLEVDGGIGLETGPRAVGAGADTLVAGVCIFGSPSPEAAILSLRAACTGGAA